MRVKWLSVGCFCPLKDIYHYLETLLVIMNEESSATGIGGLMSRMLLNILQYTGRCPWQRTIQPKRQQHWTWETMSWAIELTMRVPDALSLPLMFTMRVPDALCLSPWRSPLQSQSKYFVGTSPIALSLCLNSNIVKNLSHSLRRLWMPGRYE